MATVARGQSAQPKRKPRLFLTGGWYVLGLLVLSVIAFWPIYVMKLPFEAEYWVNVHTVGVVVWMLMLIGQPLLIRAGRRPLHKKIGKLSYALVPFILMSAMLLAHHRIAALPP
ncbi:MAG TPA: hypothetical protein VM308_04195, partial [Sphingomicrobium sp.]|nr:hypothetical protein [Sphingomicrobium sp.]